MGLRTRLIARLDIKGPNVIKGVRMEGLRVVGNPREVANRYAWEADELLYIDTVASLYGRNHLHGLLEEASREVFCPVTAGGGIRTLEDGLALLRSGADRLAINTHAIARPALISEIASYVGSQAITVSIEAKRAGDSWEAYTDCGRQKTGRDAVEWAREAQDLGAGEILLTSIDRDGTRSGMDLELIEEVARWMRVPLVAGGGAGSARHVRQALDAGADAVAVGSALHYGIVTIKELRDGIATAGKFQAEGRCEEGRAAAG